MDIWPLFCFSPTIECLFRKVWRKIYLNSNTNPKERFRAGAPYIIWIFFFFNELRYAIDTVMLSSLITAGHTWQQLIHSSIHSLSASQKAEQNSSLCQAHGRDLFPSRFSSCLWLLPSCKSLSLILMMMVLPCNPRSRRFRNATKPTTSYHLKDLRELRFKVRMGGPTDAPWLDVNIPINF